MEKIKKSIKRIVQYYATHPNYQLDEDDYDFLQYVAGRFDLDLFYALVRDYIDSDSEIEYVAFFSDIITALKNSEESKHKDNIAKIIAEYRVKENFYKTNDLLITSCKILNESSKHINRVKEEAQDIVEIIIDVLQCVIIDAIWINGLCSPWKSFADRATED